MLGDCTMPDNITTYTFTNEKDLLERFLDIWEEDPDIVTGWNVKFFRHMPYLYARMDRVIEEAIAENFPQGDCRASARCPNTKRRAYRV